MGHRAGLAEAEALGDRRPGTCPEFVDHLDRQRDTAREAALDAGEIEAVDPGVAEDADIHGRHHRDETRPELVQGVDQLVRLGLGDQDVAPAQVEGVVHAGGEAHDMEERQRPRHHLVVFASEGREPGVDLLQLTADIAVGEHGSLGDPGGPAGVLQHRQVIHRHRGDFRHGDLLFEQGAPGIEVCGGRDLGGRHHPGRLQGRGEVVFETGVDDPRIAVSLLRPAIRPASRSRVTRQTAPESLSWWISSRSV